MSRRKSISAYTPSNTDPEILKRIFVQRKKLFNQITERYCRSVTSGDKYHALLVGPRGSGKTHIVSLVEWELRKRSSLGEKMCICWLGEDDSFTSLIHFSFGIAKQLAKAYPNDFPEEFKDSVRGLPKDAAALSVLNSVVEKLGDRTLVLITENLDQTFRALGDSGRKKWRAFLQETRCITTLATSQQLFDGVSKREEVFFGFFDIQHLEVLSVKDASELIRLISIEQNNLDLVSYLDSAQGRYRVRALHYLAGGNHRMYVLLAEFLTRESLDSLVSAFEDLAEELTPYFQERMRSLPDQQRQLAQCLCDAEGALTVKQISEDTFIDERTSSKQLGNLKKNGYVRSERRGKESYYDMAEPLMRLCLEVKNQRGEPLRLVARFLRAWFPENLLLKERHNLDVKSRVDSYRAAAVKSSKTFDKAIASNIETEINTNIQAGKYDLASTLAEELLFANESSALLAEARLGTAQGNLSLALDKCTCVIESSDSTIAQRAIALLSRAAIHGKQSNFELELSDYIAVIEMSDAPAEQRAIALGCRAITHGEQGNVELEIADYTAAIEVADTLAEYRAVPLINRAFTYNKLGNYKLELADYTAVIEMSDAPAELRAIALTNRGITYGKQNNVELELADYTAVVEISDAPAEQRAFALFRRGSQIWRQRDYSKCALDFRAVLDLKDISKSIRTSSLFALVEPLIAIDSKQTVLSALEYAFNESESKTDGYGGTPENMLFMILKQNSLEWPAYCSGITTLYDRYGVLDMLGQGITKSIQHLDEGDYTESQINAWLAAWQAAGDQHDDLRIPLLCLEAATAVVRSDSPTDLPLLRLPIEIRRLVRPLLNNTLGLASE